MRVLDLNNPEDKAFWYDHRRIGSADASAIMGEDKWQTQYSCWLFKTYRKERTAPNKYMQRGIDKEAFARTEFEFEYGDSFPAVNIVHDKYDYIVTALDGLNQSQTLSIEIKCPGKPDHELALAGIIPPHYTARLDHILLVTDHEKVAYVSYEPGMGCKTIWYYRDEKKIKALLKAELAFWKYVQTDEPPPLSMRDYVPRMDDEWLELAEKFLELDAIIKVSETKKTAVKDQLVKLADGHPSLGGGVRYLTYPQKGALDKDAIIQDKDEMIKELVDIMGEPYPKAENYDSESRRKDSIQIHKVAAA